MKPGRKPEEPGTKGNPKPEKHKDLEPAQEVSVSTPLPHVGFFKACSRRACCLAQELAQTKFKPCHGLQPQAHSVSGSLQTVIEHDTSFSGWGGRDRFQHEGCLPRGSFGVEATAPRMLSSRQLRCGNFGKQPIVCQCPLQVLRAIHPFPTF